MDTNRVGIGGGIKRVNIAHRQRMVFLVQIQRLL